MIKKIAEINELLRQMIGGIESANLAGFLVDLGYTPTEIAGVEIEEAAFAELEIPANFNDDAVNSAIINIVKLHAASK